MANDFLAGISQVLLNQVSSEMYPGIENKLTQTSTLQSPAVTVTWSVNAAPVFDLSTNSINTFNLIVPITIQITPTGGSPTSENLQATGNCKISINSPGVLTLGLSDISFATSDPFVQAILGQKKTDIMAAVQNILQAIQVPLGPVEGITFNGYATAIQNAVLYAGASTSGSTSIDQYPSVGTGFGISLSNSLLQQLVANVWWPSAPKNFSQGDATVNINSYSFNVQNGLLVLNLNMGGGISVGIDLLFYTIYADWSLDFDGPVVANINISIDSNRNVILNGGNVSAPSVSANPDNAAAWTASIATGDIISGIMGSLVSSDIPSGIQSHLSGTVFTIPIINNSFGSGITFNITPNNLNLAVNGDQVFVTGGVNATVQSSQLTLVKK